MATPMSARRSAGASLTPSPVIATTSPRARSASAMRSFASGELRAKMSSRCVAQELVERRRRSSRRAPSPVTVTSARDADPAGDSRGGESVVAGHDHDADAGVVAAGDGVGDLGSRRVEQATRPRRQRSRSASSRESGTVASATRRRATASTRSPGRGVRLDDARPTSADRSSSSGRSRPVRPALVCSAPSTASGAPLCAPTQLARRSRRRSTSA